jgi:uncharacterized protein YndB with AHSA1/START domain
LTRASALADLKEALEGGNSMTEAATRPQQVYQVFIKAPPEHVWEAITKPEFTSRYYYGCALKTDLAIGSAFTYFMPDGNPIVEGKVVESDPPRRLVHTYHSLWGELASDAPTRVTWELEPAHGGVTKLTVVHDEFEAETATYKGLATGGWSWILSNLQSLLETGEPIPQAY